MIRVVIVEDDTWLGEQYVRVFSQAGFEAHYTSNAIEAIDAIDEVKPDILILDILLAATTGLTLLHELQSHSDLAAIPVIVCTNSAADIDLKLLAPYGVKRILDKTTMRPDDLVVAVRSALL